MRIRLGYQLDFRCLQPTPIVLQLRVHPSRSPDLIVPDAVQTKPWLPVYEYLDGFGNLCSRIHAPPGDLRIHADSIIADSGAEDAVDWSAQSVPVEQLPQHALVFLLASRYCETDLLLSTAWSLFGHTPAGWARVQAICDFVHQHLAFGYQHARATRSAHEAYRERIGVCRDFAHLAITLCRCMNIPARYCTGYLGDIGIPAVPGPMDFSAWFEVYLGDRWHTFDARHNRPRIGRVLIARGRDATDVSLSTAFGAPLLKGLQVTTDELIDPPLLAVQHNGGSV